MNKIAAKKIHEEKIEVFDDQDLCVGYLNMNEFLDLRIQIARNKAVGYWIDYDNQHIPIDCNGNLTKTVNKDWFFGTTINLCNELKRVQMKNGVKV